MRRSITRVTAIALGVLLLAHAVSARAGLPSAKPITFDFVFQGTSASAVGFVTFDENLLPNPANCSLGFNLPDPAVLDLHVTVSGAASGNGTFGLSDFTQIAWCTSGATLDLGAQLVGQPTPGDPWGTPGGAGGDFNLFGSAPRPRGLDYFTLCADEGDADCMTLTSMLIRPRPITLDFVFEDLAGSARAVGFITVDENLLPNPASCNLPGLPLPNPAVLNLRVTVSGAAGGNGTFGLSDFTEIAWCTNGATLDFGAQLVGQPTPDDPWGTPADLGSSGDFNLFGDAPRPNGEDYFTLCANGGGADCMTLTSMRVGPATPISFDFTFEGVGGSAARAEGSVTVDENLLPNPANCDFNFRLPNPAVFDLDVTVSGATSGNGAFGLSDFTQIAWCTNGATLDLGAQLVGQPTSGDLWGTPGDDGSSGDFNLFGAAPRPNGVDYFTLCANGGGADCMTLSSMIIGPEFQCIGNCSGGGSVTVDELVFGVNILNGKVLPGRCRALSPDGTEVTLDQVVAAVSNALAGCL